MKSVVDGKLYDTGTAVELGTSLYGVPGDFNYCREVLYKTKNERCFLFGEGVPNRKYDESGGTNTRSGGSRIIPLTLKEAFEWAQEHDLVAVCESEFADPGPFDLL
ncbi:hypothetical protein ES703_110784 [subsurface metagenome]